MNSRYGSKLLTVGTYIYFAQLAAIAVLFCCGLGILVVSDSQNVSIPDWLIFVLISGAICIAITAALLRSELHRARAAEAQRTLASMQRDATHRVATGRPATSTWQSKRRAS